MPGMPAVAHGPAHRLVQQHGADAAVPVAGRDAQHTGARHAAVVRTVASTRARTSWPRAEIASADAEKLEFLRVANGVRTDGPSPSGPGPFSGP
jgi:hypothetical protein